MSTKISDYKKLPDKLLKPKRPKVNFIKRIKAFIKMCFSYLGLRIKYRKQIKKRIKVYKCLRQGVTVLKWMSDQFPNKHGRKQFIRDACKKGFVHNRWIDYYEGKIEGYEKHLKNVKKIERQKTKERKKLKKAKVEPIKPFPKPPKKDKVNV